MKYLFVIAFLVLSLTAYCQPGIQVEVSADTIEIGKTVEIKYTIQNGDGKFLLPSLDSLPVLSGPNSSSSFMYQNGEQHSSQSYSFVLLGMEEGKLLVPGTRYVSGGNQLEIAPVEIVVIASMNQIPAGKDSGKITSKSKREKRVF
jgi:hypothetical protein